METLIFLYLLVFPFGQLGRFEIAPAVVLHAADILVSFVAVAWILRWLGGQRKVPALSRPFAAFTVVAAFSLLFAATKFSLTEVFIGSLYLVRFASYMLFYFAVWNLARKKIFREKLLNALVAVGAFVSIFGLVQYILFPSTRALIIYGWDEHFARLVGTFFDPGFTGILLVLFLILVIVRVWEEGRVGRTKFFLFFVLGFLALALTYSRASYLAFLSALTTFYIVRRNWRIAIGGTLLLLATIFLLPRPGGEGVNLSRASTVFSRIESYDRALATAGDNPIFGVGFNLYRFAGGDLVSHSGAGSDASLLFVFATTGIVGLLTYFGLIARIISLAWEKRKTVQGCALVASAAALFVHSLFNNSLFYPWVLGFTGILLAVQED